jgi:hypothetical protein
MPPNLIAVKNCGSKKAIHEVHLGWNVMKMSLKALTFEESEQAIALIDFGPGGFPQTKLGP